MEEKITRENQTENFDKNQNTQEPQTIIIKQANQSNGIAIAGFVLLIVSLVFCWMPLLGLLFWVLGALFCIIGLFREPKGFAIAGVILIIIDGIVSFYILDAIADFLFGFLAIFLE